MTRCKVWKSVLLSVVVAGCGGALTPEAHPTCTLVQSTPSVVVQFLPPLEGAPLVAATSVFGGEPTPGALRGTVYWLPERTAHLMDPAALQPVATLYTPRLDVSPRSFAEGFPGVPGGRTEWFQIAYDGSFVVRTGGVYNFRVFSDDAGRVTVDDRVVAANNNQNHMPESGMGNVALSPGVHSLRVDYYQGPRYQIALMLYVTPPGQPERIFDTSIAM